MTKIALIITLINSLTLVAVSIMNIMQASDIRRLQTQVQQLLRKSWKG